jgi:hypothetical protein
MCTYNQLNGQFEKKEFDMNVFKDHMQKWQPYAQCWNNEGNNFLKDSKLAFTC